MVFQNFNETVNAAMNTLAETNRNIGNIGLLETSITMQSFSAVAMETQADAAELMIRDEGSRKDAIIDHLFELHAECLERMQEVNELIKSAADEYSFYVEEAWANRNDRESAQICQDLAEKAMNSSKGYSNDWQNLYDLSKQIMATIAGESSPRTLPVTTTDELPFESVPVWRNPSATRISQFEFSKAVNTMLQKSDVLASIESYCQLDAAQLAENLRENSPTYKNHVKSALESAIYDNAQDEQTADALTDAVNVYFDAVLNDVQEALEEYAAPLPSQRRINANIGYSKSAVMNIQNEDQFLRFVYQETFGKHPDEFRTKDDDSRAIDAVVANLTDNEAAHLEKLGII